MLTILIPSYNHESYIVDCLSEAVNVDVDNLKIIVIDDGSTDETPSLVRRFIEDHKDHHNIVLIEKENSGLVSSLNIGLNNAETEFFYIVASDDIPDPVGIEKLVDKLRQNKTYKFIIGGAKYLSGKKALGSVYNKDHDDFFKLPENIRSNHLFLNYPSPVLLQSTVFRVSALKNVRGWDAGLILDDYPMFIKMLTEHSILGRDFGFSPEINTVMYRIHGENSYRNTKRQFKMVLQVLERFCPKSIKSRAVGKLSAYYILVCIRKHDARALFSILVATPFGTLGWLINYIFLLVILRLSKL